MADVRTAFRKEIFRSISHSLSRFGAIFMIVALGAGFYAGLRMCAPDMRKTVDRYFDDTAFMDVHLISTLGFSDADVAAVRSVDGVSAVMPTHVADVIATIGERRATARIHGIDLEAAAASDTSNGERAVSSDADYLNRPILVAGRWPETSGECVIDSSKVFANTAQLGDPVTLLEGTADLAGTFTRTEFTVVGVVESSYYLSFSRGTTTLGDGGIDRVVYISNDDFVDPGVYTDIFVTAKGAAGVSTFTSSYDALVDPVTAVLESLAPAREAARLAEVKSEARGALDAKRAEYDTARADADARFADVEAELDAAARAIASSAAQLDGAQAEYDSGVASLAAERQTAAARFSEAQLAIENARTEIQTRQAGLDELAAALTLLGQQVTTLETASADLQTAYGAALAAEAGGEVVSPTSAELAVQLAGTQAQLATAQETYGAQSATYDAGVTALGTARAELDARQVALDAARDQAGARFLAVERQLAAARRQIASGRLDLADGRQSLSSSRVTYEQEKANAEVDLADALAQIEDAQAEVDAIEPPTWYVLGRATNVGYASFVGDADRIEAISLVFPFIFFLVAALVALTTMTRMVDEERTLIGTYKALGYGKGRITAKYVVYAGLASLFGSLFGILIGSHVMPYTVWQAYKTMYTAPNALTPIDVPIALAAGAASVGITLLATFLAVATTLREVPATLMLPRAPKPGKRIFLERIKPVWSRLSFSRKVTARNLFRYKKRLLMTVIGIAGCTALLLTGFGLKDSIGDILDKQYGEIYRYNTTIGLDSDEFTLDDPAGVVLSSPSAESTTPASVESTTPASAESTATLSEILRDTGSFSGYLVVRVESIRIENVEGRSRAAESTGRGAVSGSNSDAASSGESVGASIDGYICVPSEPGALGDFIVLRNRVTRSPVTLDDSGVVITEKAANELDVGVGDTIYVEQLDAIGNTTGEAATALTVSGITEQYVSHFIYISPTLYEQAFGALPSYNEAFGTVTVADDTAKQRLSQALLAQDGITTVQFTEDITSSFDSMLQSLDSVVLILILSAGLLAFIVLYNLTNINVTERQREIATIKVLGFYDSEVNAYIYRETAALTIIGGVLGLLLGIALEAFVITTVEVDIVMFGRAIHATSYLYSAALTAAFAVIVNLAMRRRLRSIDMVESLKSVE